MESSKILKPGETIPVGFISTYVLNDPYRVWKVASTEEYLGKFERDDPQPKSKIAFVARFEYGNLEYFSGGGFSIKTSVLITPTEFRDKRQYGLKRTTDIQRSTQTPGSPPVSPAVPMPVSPAVTQPVASNDRISNLENELKSAKRTIEVLQKIIKSGIPQTNDDTQGGKRKSKRKSRRKN